jgi:undecaprenyl-diphosphatase
VIFLEKTSFYYYWGFQGMFYIILLAIIQGITEFLPVSSSAHLVIFHKIFGNLENYLLLDIGLHLGSLFAILLYYKETLFNSISNITKDKMSSKNLINKVFIAFMGFIPIAALVFFTVINIKTARDIRSSYMLLIFNSIVFALILYKHDVKRENRDINELSLKELFSIGLYQSLSVFPGVSRSGISITRARMLGLSRDKSVEFSMLLAIPTIIAAGGVSTIRIIMLNDFAMTTYFLTAIITSFIFSYISLSLFVKYIKKHSFKPFIVYRIAISIILAMMVLSDKI